MREQKLRDTNESTNERVKWFAFGTIGMLVGLGAWQLVYLRAYFRYVQDRILPAAMIVYEGCASCCMLLRSNSPLTRFSADPSTLSRYLQTERAKAMAWLSLDGSL